MRQVLDNILASERRQVALPPAALEAWRLATVGRFRAWLMWELLALPPVVH
jgi:hypothetical protein